MRSQSHVTLLLRLLPEDPLTILLDSRSHSGIMDSLGVDIRGGGGGGAGGSGGGGSGGGGGGDGGGDDYCKDEVNDSGGMGDWRRAAGGGWLGHDGDNEVDDRSCEEVHCYSGVKFLHFLVENLRWEITAHIVWY